MIKIFRKKGQGIFRRKKRKNVLAVFLHGWGKRKQPSVRITSYPVRKLKPHEDEYELFSKTEDDWREELKD